MKKITVAIAGCGSRGLNPYAKCLEKFADRAEIVAVADIRPDRVAVAAERYHIPADMCFDSVESMLKAPKLADVMFICTADTLFKLAKGKTDPVLAFTTGKLKVEGNIDKALKLGDLLARKRKG